MIDEIKELFKDIGKDIKFWWEVIKNMSFVLKAVLLIAPTLGIKVIWHLVSKRKRI